ncbi:phasin family protein [Sphingorhabdus profundilacus]|uniref:phasin family protein n=1 Tax=Sphingorhabdus profundilacus TaxID=2509718 RepID=UPI001C5516C6|nr:phasin family protein [Sphingorhabdus profundilacus]
MARTAPELIQLQSEFARTKFTTAIAEYSKLTQSMFQTTIQIFEPLQQQAMTAAQIKDLVKDWILGVSGLY